MRMIDADKLKRELKDDYDRNDMFCLEYHFETLRICRNIIDAQPTIGGWISVKDRLPEETEDVLIYGYWSGVSGQTYKETWLANMKEFIYQGNIPIAWMPLPEPPKE